MKNTFILLLFNLFVLSLLAQKADKELFNVYNVRSEEDGSTVVYANNSFECDESLIIEFTALKNMKADVELPFKAVIPPGVKEYKLFTLTIKDKTKASQLGYVSKYCHGDIFNSKHSDDYIYTLPYKEGESYSVDQGYGGKFSHYMKGKTHAIDFAMDEGTIICAARDGIVIGVKDDSNKHGKTIQFQEFGNYITIYHNDGTMANYFHIEKKGSKVKVGDKVTAGQEIGYSGNTGWSSGPHLHFQVYSFNEAMDVKTIPTKFLQEDGKAIILEKNKDGYKSVHPTI
jgi:murein DD-endopeptidase MepM/ murein hydrolase activator NlpD